MEDVFFNPNTKIAIIGFGRFGRLLVNILLKYSQAKILLITTKKSPIFHKNLELRSLNKIGEADIIIPCIPISTFQSVIQHISPFMKKNAIIMDVCSVKMLPVVIMKKYLPRSVQIIASHPMFGPNSYRANKGLKGLKLILRKIRAKKETYQQFKRFFSLLGLKVIELSPRKHDKYLAFSLGYSYFLGKISQRVHIKKTPIDSYDFELLLEHVSIIKSDSEELFFDMQTKNPFAKNMHRLVKDTLSILLREINLQSINNNN